MLILILLETCYGQNNLFDISIFGAPGTDTVEIDYVNGFGIINSDLPKPEQAPNISEAHFSDYINPEDYPWPNHPMNGTCTWSQLQKETNNIIAFYSRDNLTQSEMYRHPAALPQYYGTFEQIDNAPRVEIRYTLTPKYNRHFIPAFIPPGEIVTLEIPESMQGKLTIIFNQNFNTIPDQNGKPQMDTRLPQMQFSVTLTQKVNTIGSPYGGNLCFSYNGDEPVEINITNVVLQPYFVYGQTSDEEWINDISKWPGPYAWFDTGNMIHVVPSYIVRDVTRISDCMKWWRSAYQISQTTAKDPYNPRNARVTDILEMFYEQFIFMGGAVAVVGSNICYLPVDWINSVLRYDSLMDNPWGIVHEMNHHHQDNWGLAQPEHSEMTNNAISLLTYALTNKASSPRNENPNGHGLYDWAQYSIGTLRLNENASVGTGLSRYSTLLHLFGPTKFKIFVSSDQEDKWFSRQQFGNAGAELLRASKVFNRDLRYHYNFHGTSDEVLNEKGAFIELDKMNLKPFHPVLNTYAVGSIVDGKRVISVRPYIIPSTPIEINFVTQMVYRTNCEPNLFGNFEYYGAHFEPERSDFWNETSPGVFIVTPKKNFTAIEEVIVDYIDKTTNEIHQVICQFEQTNHYNKVTIYNNLGDQNILVAYNKTVELGPKAISSVQTYTKLSYDGSQFISGNGTILINDGMLKPDVSGEFIFTITQRFALFYLSSAPLKANPDDDAQYLINHNKVWEMSSSSDPVELNASEVYYYRLVNFEHVSPFNTAVQYSVNGSNRQDIPSDWIIGEIIPDETIWKSQYKPEFEPIYQMDQWNGETFLKNSQSQWKVYQYPGGGSVYLNGGTEINNTITEAITDSNPMTEYRCLCAPIGYLAPFPHIYEIDMGFIQTFPTIRITMAEKEINMPFDGYLEIRVAEDNGTETSSLNDDNSVVFLGHVDNTLDFIDLDTPATGRYMRLTFINNSRLCSQYPYVGEWESRTAISTLEVGTKMNSQKIYPMTGTLYFTRKDGWTETRNGIYYNGKGFTGAVGSILDISIPEEWDEIGIIGDYYPSIGRADVIIDGTKVGTIGETIYNEQIINRKLQYASRAYESILFYEFFGNVNSQHTIEIEVTEGNITLTGIIVPQNVKTSVPSATFSPSNPFTASHTLQPISSMEPTVEPSLEPTVEPTLEPTVEPTVEPIEIRPTTNDDFDSENNIIEFNKDGYTDGAKHVITNSIPDEIILIKSKISTITLKTDGFKQDKDQYLSPKLEHTIITIPSPEYNNSFEDGEIGVHANSNDPIIQISSETVPLKLFNDDISTVTVTVSTQSSQSMKLLDDSDMNFRKVELSKGNLSLHFADEVKCITFSDGIFFSTSQMKAQCNNTSIFITFEDIMLATKSTSFITKLKVTQQLEMNSMANLAVNDSADFTESPVLHFSEQSFLSFGKSRIVGVPKEINYEVNSKSTLLESQDPLICGEQFDCSLWLSSYKGNSQYPEAECRQNSNGEMCLYPVGGESNSSKKPNVGLIVGIVCGVVAIIIITIVVVLVAMKKRAEKELASDKSNPLEEFETHPPTNNTQENEPETAEENA